MRKNKYQQGATFEREIVNWLRRNGFCVIRSAGSKTLNDIIAIPLSNSLHNGIGTANGLNNHTSCVIQVKCTKSLADIAILLSDELTQFKEQRFYPKIEKYCFIKGDEIRIYRVVNCTWECVWSGERLI
mgnify:CR=1 FL=1